MSQEFLFGAPVEIATSFVPIDPRLLRATILSCRDGKLVRMPSAAPIPAKLDESCQGFEISNCRSAGSEHRETPLASNAGIISVGIEHEQEAHGP